MRAGEFCSILVFGGCSNRQPSEPNLRKSYIEAEQDRPLPPRSINIHGRHYVQFQRFWHTSPSDCKWVVKSLFVETTFFDAGEAKVWASVVKALPEEQMKFALNAALDTLPHNANLHLWQKKSSSACHLCGNNQSLLHVLNNCSVARDLRRYNIRHDLVLQEIASAIRPLLRPTTVLSVDLGESYDFPTHIVPTDLRPDIVWWDPGDRSMCLAELTVCFESNFMDAAQRKTAKYMDLFQQVRDKGYKAQLLTLEVGSRGVPHFVGFETLANTLSMSSKELSNLLMSTTRAAIAGSFSIWCSRNRKSDPAT